MQIEIKLTKTQRVVKNLIRVIIEIVIVLDIKHENTSICMKCKKMKIYEKGVDLEHSKYTSTVSQIVLENNGGGLRQICIYYYNQIIINDIQF